MTFQSSITLLLLFLALTGSVQATEKRQIDVYGKSTVATVPDTFSFTFTLQQKGKQAAVLNELITKRAEEVVQQLIEIGIKPKAIQALQVQFSPWVEYENKKQQQKGFILTRNITVTSHSLSLYNQAIDKMLSLGIEQLHGFSASSSKAEQAYQEAIQQGLKNAKQKAQNMAASLGLKLAEVIAISELSSGEAKPVFAVESLRAQSSSYQPGEVNTQARVKVVFALTE